MISLPSVAALAPPPVQQAAMRAFAGASRSDENRAKADPRVLMEVAPRELQERATALIRANDRVPEVCLHVPERYLNGVRSFAERQDWQARQPYTDDRPWSACAGWPGWGLVRQQVRAGRADGVVVLTHSDTGADRGWCAEELAWFGSRLAFVAMVEGGRR